MNDRDGWGEGEGESRKPVLEAQDNDVDYVIISSVVGNTHSNQSSKPGLGCLHFPRTNTLDKGMNPTILPPAISK